MYSAQDFIIFDANIQYNRLMYIWQIKEFPLFTYEKENMQSIVQELTLIRFGEYEDFAICW